MEAIIFSGYAFRFTAPLPLTKKVTSLKQLIEREKNSSFEVFKKYIFCISVKKFKNHKNLATN